MDCLDENEALDHVVGRVSAARGDAIDAHLDGCVRCRKLMAALARTAGELDARLVAPAEQIGRYIVLDWIGEGAMGVVWRAFDPRLDRTIALKIVRPELASGETRRRLLEEARAVARLSHPAVVTVFDAGPLDDGVHLAMELIEGTDLRGWLDARPRDPTAILEVFRRAGEGLAAAHAAGIVHRDFKPANVLVGGSDDRPARVCVGDFGLATATPHDHAGGVGTPAYMAPEQHDGRPIDARVDQFAFCVALWQALAHRLPFAGASIEDVHAACRAGRFSAMPEGVPARVRRALVRGLAWDRDDRFPDMPALLAAITPRRRGRRTIAVAAATLAAMSIGWVAFAGEDRCVADARATRAAWTSAAPRVAEAFSAARLAYADASFARVDAAMRSHGDDLAELARTSCELGDASSARTHCLDATELERDGVIELLSDPDPIVIATAPQIVHGLTPPDRCRDAVVGEDVFAVRDDAVRTFAALAEAHGRRLIGDVEAARSGASAAASMAAHAGLLAAEADAMLLLGKLSAERGGASEAEPILWRAVAAAERAHRDDLRAHAMLALALTWARVPGREAAARALADTAALVGETHAFDVEAIRAFIHGIADRTNHHDGDARENLELALALAERDAEPDDPHLALFASALGEVLGSLGLEDDARAVLAHALARAEAASGPSNPRTATIRFAIAVRIAEAGDHERAAHEMQEVRAVLAGTIGDDAETTLAVRADLAWCLSRIGRVDEALAEYRAIAAAWEARGIATGVSETLVRTGDVLYNDGRRIEALASYQESVALAEGAADPQIASASLPVARALGRVGESLLALDRPHDAIAPLERALAIHRRSGSDAPEVDEITAALARARWASDRTLARDRD